MTYDIIFPEAIYLSQTRERHHGPGAVGHGLRLEGGVESLHVVVLHPQLHVVLQRRDVHLGEIFM